MNGENAMNLWDVFAVFEPIGKDSECKSLRSRDSFLTTCAVHKDAGKIGHFADPATIVLSLDLNGEIAHSGIVQLRSRFEIQRLKLTGANRRREENSSRDTVVARRFASGATS